MLSSLLTKCENEFRIRETKDYQQILGIMKAIGSETHDLENTDQAWIASLDSRDVGLVGIRNLNPDYVVIVDGSAADLLITEKATGRDKKAIVCKSKGLSSRENGSDL